jgi:predicted DNA-binding protein YlxM (UPF0122 family)
MFEKNLKMACLLDFYGEVLSERKQAVLSMYYNDDMSLAEIADEVRISRQGVRELIKKAEEELTFFEEKLGLFKTFREAQTHLASLDRELSAETASASVRSDIEALIRLLG